MRVSGIAYRRVRATSQRSKVTVPSVTPPPATATQNVVDSSCWLPDRPYVTEETIDRTSDAKSESTVTSVLTRASAARKRTTSVVAATRSSTNTKHWEAMRSRVSWDFA